MMCVLLIWIIGAIIPFILAKHADSEIPLHYWPFILLWPITAVVAIMANIINILWRSWQKWRIDCLFREYAAKQARIMQLK